MEGKRVGHPGNLCNLCHLLLSYINVISLNAFIYCTLQKWTFGARLYTHLYGYLA